MTHIFMLGVQVLPSFTPHPSQREIWIFFYPVPSWSWHDCCC